MLDSAGWTVSPTSCSGLCAYCKEMKPFISRALSEQVNLLLLMLWNHLLNSQIKPGRFIFEHLPFSNCSVILFMPVIALVALGWWGNFFVQCFLGTFPLKWVTNVYLDTLDLSHLVACWQQHCSKSCPVYHQPYCSFGRTCRQWKKMLFFLFAGLLFSVKTGPDLHSSWMKTLS